MASEEGIRLLRECHAMLKKLTTGMGGGVADEADLEGPHGDPEVKAMPRDWVGDNFKGKRYSETDPDFLLKLADMLDYFANKKKDEEPKKAEWDRRDARRARAWSERLRSGWKSPNQPKADANPEGW